MIRKSKDLNKLTDDEFESIIKPFDEKIYNYITNEIINEFVAYYISTAFDMDALWDGDFRLTAVAAVETLAQLDIDSCDLEKIKSILEDNYKLKVIQDKPTMIEDLR